MPLGRLWIKGAWLLSPIFSKETGSRPGRAYKLQILCFIKRFYKSILLWNTYYTFTPLHYTRCDTARPVFLQIGFAAFAVAEAVYFLLE